MPARIRSVVVVSDAPPAAPSFPSCRKRRGRKGALGYIWCILPLNLGEALFFRCRSTRWSPYGFFDCAPPDTGVPNLQLVSVEYLPSIEGALEIQMNVTFLRGKAPLPGELSPKVTERLLHICGDLSVSASPSHLPWEGRPWGTHSNGFPYEGKLSAAG